MKDFGLKLACRQDIKFIMMVAAINKKPVSFWSVARAIIKSNKKILTGNCCNSSDSDLHSDSGGAEPSFPTILRVDNSSMSEPSLLRSGM